MYELYEFVLYNLYNCMNLYYRVGIILRKDHFKKHMLLTQKGFQVATLVCRVVRKVDTK